MSSQKEYTLGLDLGTTSIGYALVDKKNHEVIEAGSRIIISPRVDKGNDYKNAKRRESRGRRRNLERKKQIKRNITTYLHQKGWIDFTYQDLLNYSDIQTNPQSTKNLDPAVSQSIKEFLQETNEGSVGMGAFNRYLLRKEGLERQLSKKELAKILFSFSNIRGYKSNSRNGSSSVTEDSSKNEAAEKAVSDSKKALKGIDDLQRYMKDKGFKTYGQVFYHLLKKRDERQADAKQAPNKKEKMKIQYESTLEKVRGLYTSRDDYKSEYDLIMEKQIEFYPDLESIETTSDGTDILVKDKIKDMLFEQRPLKSQKEKIGICQFYDGEQYEGEDSPRPSEKRAHKLQLESQDYVLLQDIGNMKLNASQVYVMNKENKDKAKKMLEQFNIDKHELFDFLRSEEESTWTKIKAKIGNIPLVVKWNYTPSKRIKGNLTHIELAKILGDSWTSKTYEQQSNFVSAFIFFMGVKEKEIFAIFKNGNLDKIISKYIQKDAKNDEYQKTISGVEKAREDFPLSPDKVKEVLGFFEDNFAKGYMNLSLKALREFNSYMKEDKKTQYEAKEDLGFCREKKRDEFDDELKPADDLMNPVVNKGLSQVRFLVNKIIHKYGKPTDIVVELARDFANTEKDRKKMEETNRTNEKERKEASEALKPILGREASRGEILKYRLFKELRETPSNAVCPYCLTTITLTDVFKNDKAQVEHILPLSRSLNNRQSNMTLACVSCNQEKGNRCPVEYLSKEDLDKSIARLTKLNSGKGFWANRYNWKLRQFLLAPRYAPEFEEKGANFLYKDKTTRKFVRVESPSDYDSSKMDRIGWESVIAGNDDRELTDTRYFSRATREYLSGLYSGEDKYAVKTTHGSITSFIRDLGKINGFLIKSDEGLKKSKKAEIEGQETENNNSQEHAGKNLSSDERKKNHENIQAKERDDLRHHALDAMVIAMVDEKMRTDIDAAKKIADYLLKSDIPKVGKDGKEYGTYSIGLEHDHYYKLQKKYTLDVLNGDSKIIDYVKQKIEKEGKEDFKAIREAKRNFAITPEKLDRIKKSGAFDIVKNMKDQIKKALDKVVVSFEKNNSSKITGALHEETCYGMDKFEQELHVKTDVGSISSKLKKVKDETLKNYLEEHFEREKEEEKKNKEKSVKENIDSNLEQSKNKAQVKINNPLRRKDGLTVMNKEGDPILFVKSVRRWKNNPSKKEEGEREIKPSNLDPVSKKSPYQYFDGGNNHHIALFKLKGEKRNKEGFPIVEGIVVSALIAAQRKPLGSRKKEKGSKGSLIYKNLNDYEEKLRKKFFEGLVAKKTKPEDWEFMYSLQINDIIASKKTGLVFRVKKMSQSKRLGLDLINHKADIKTIPLDSTVIRYNKEDQKLESSPFNEADQNLTSEPSPSTLNAYKLYLDIFGDIKKVEG